MLEAPSKIPNAQQNVSKYTQKYYKINFFARTNTKETNWSKNNMCVGIFTSGYWPFNWGVYKKKHERMKKKMNINKHS